MTRDAISGISPFFIVRDVPTGLRFHRDTLDFEVTFQEPAVDPFFAIVCRDGTMPLEIRRFREGDFPEYQSWFEDPELNRQLGPMDQEWLDAVLNETTGMQYSFTSGDELVVVAGVCWPANGVHYLTELAVRPNLQRRGFGAEALALLLAQPEFAEAPEWRAAVHRANVAGQAFFRKIGWNQSVHINDGDNDYLEFVRSRLSV